MYRIGGDEFVLMTTSESLELANIKASLAAEEASLVDLKIEEKPPIGLNFGLIKHNPGISIKQESKSADEIMQDDKKRMYLKYGLERRK